MTAQLAQRTGSAMLWQAIQVAGVKAIFLARTLILARLLAPDDFGLLALSMIAVDFLLSVTNFGMMPALVQQGHVDERHYNIAWTIGLTRALVIALVVILSAPLIASLVAEPRATDLIRVVALRPVLEAAASIKVAALTRDLHFRALAFLRLPEALAHTVVSVALAPAWGVWALVAGALAGPAAYVVMSYILAPYRPGLEFDAAAAAPLIRYGRWILLTGLIAVSGSSLLQVVISRRLGAAELGLYFLAARLAFIPTEVSAEVVGAVAFPLYARLQADAQQKPALGSPVLSARAFRAILTGLAALLVPLCALMIALAPSLVENVLGPRWEGTAPLIRLLALVNGVGLFGDTVGPMLKGVGQPYRLAVIEFIQSLLLITLIWGLADRFGVVGAALAWLAAVGASQIISALFVQHILRQPFAGLAGPITVITAVSALGALVALSVDAILPGLIGLVMATLLALLVIGVLLWVADRQFAFGLVRDVSRAFPRVAALAGYAPVDAALSVARLGEPGGEG